MAVEYINDCFIDVDWNVLPSTQSRDVDSDLISYTPKGTGYIRIINDVDDENNAHSWRNKSFTGDALRQLSWTSISMKDLSNVPLDIACLDNHDKSALDGCHKIIYSGIYDNYSYTSQKILLEPDWEIYGRLDI